MQATGASALRAMPKTNTFAGEGAGPATNSAAREAMREAVQMRSELRKQRIQQRVEEASTQEAAFQDPSEQWQSYLARCGRWSPGGRGRKPSPDRQRLAHQTSQRIFSEQAAAVEEAVRAHVGGGLDTVLDFTATVAAHDAAANEIASAALRRASPSRKPREPVRDSHGNWVGEAVESQLAGSAGASSAEIGAKREDNRYEHKRLEFLEKAVKSKALIATGAGPTEDFDNHTIAAEPMAAEKAEGAAGLTSKSLYRNQREKSGLLDEERSFQHMKFDELHKHSNKLGRRGDTDSTAAPRRPSVGVDAPYAWDPDRVTDPDRPTSLNSRPSFGIDGAVDVTDYTIDKTTSAGPREVAGLTSSEMYEVQFKRQVKSAPRADDGNKVAGVKSAELAAASTEMKIESSPRPMNTRNPDHRIENEAKAALTDASNLVAADAANISIASSAPAKCFDGAAGMNSAQVYKARSEIQQRRHVSPSMLGPASRADDAKDGPVPKLPLKASGVVMGSPDKGEEPYAGQRSCAIQKPTSAWEARHLWSEAQKVPKGGFGDRVGAAKALEGGAGMRSDQLASYSKELKFESRGASPRAVRAPPADAPEPAKFDGAAGLTSSKICEIGVGMVNKYDLPSPGRKGPLLTKADAREKLAGAAGRTSSEIATSALADQTAEQKRLSALAARAAAARALSPGAQRPAPSYEDTPAFSGAAGVVSAQLGKGLAKREFLSDDVAGPEAAAAPRGASPHRRSNSSGVSSIFGGADAPSLTVDVDRAGVDAFSRGEVVGHGMSSRAVAIQRLVSRHAHGVIGGKRSMSEPRRRPSTGGTDAASLLYGNAFAESEQPSAVPYGMSAQHDVAAQAGRVAGRTSGDLAIPREERRLSRSGNMADNLWGSGGLGGYMGGGLEACKRRDSGNFDTLQLRKAAAGSPRPAAAPIEGSQPKGWSPARAMPQRRQSFGGGENSVGALLGGGGGGHMVTSSSAIGAGWGVGQSAAMAQAASPMRGLRA